VVEAEEHWEEGEGDRKEGQKRQGKGKRLGKEGEEHSQNPR